MDRQLGILVGVRLFDVCGTRRLFGNLVTNLKPPVRRMRIHNHDIVATATTYADGRPNEPFVYIGSMGYLEVAVRDARADKLLGARSGMKVELMP